MPLGNNRFLALLHHYVDTQGGEGLTPKHVYLHHFLILAVQEMPEKQSLQFSIEWISEAFR